MNRKVIIVEDHRMVAEALDNLLKGYGYETQIFADGYAFSKAVEGLSPQNTAVLLDLNLGNISGLEILPELAQRGFLVLIISVQSELFYVSRALELGAKGYVPKEASLECLREALDEVFAGGRYLCPELKDKMVFSRKGLSVALSDREEEVLHCLVKGSSMKEIAAKMNLSSKTVASFKARIMKKIGAVSDVDIYKFAYVNGILKMK